jgi:flagellar hook-associated protein 1 FlgK
MGVGLFSLFNIARTSFFANQRALAVTGQNLANVNTPGYSRQQVVLSETLAQSDTPGQIGTGVQVDQVRRVVDSLIETQLNVSNGTLGRLDVYSRGLGALQGQFGDSQDRGIGVALNEFFKAVQDVATNPTDVTARSVLINRGTALAGLLNGADTDLNNQRRSLDRQVSQSITDANSLIVKIADLNVKIVSAEVGGRDNANDLRDQRQRLLNDLSTQLDVTYLEDSTGQVTVFAGKGLVLASKGDYKQLVGVANSSNGGFLDVRYDPGNGVTPFTINSVISQGKLKGFLDLRDTTIPGLITSLDTMTSSLVSQVNTVHAAGYGLDGTTGRNFFTAAGTTASSISVAISDPRYVAASSSLEGLPGNNAQALALGALQNTAITALGSITMGEYYGRTASNLGVTTQGTQRDLQAQETIQEQLDQQRGSVSGVSIDEELINLLKHQRAFDASARMITATDEMLQTLLNLTR